MFLLLLMCVGILATHRIASAPSALLVTLLAGSALGSLSGCAELDIKSEGPIRGRDSWVLLPMQNHSESKRAGERAEDLLTTLLRSEKGVELLPYPVVAKTIRRDKEGAETGESEEPDERLRFERALAWARNLKFAYGVGGSVQEWGYRAGTDGEPAVSLSLRVIDLKSGRVIYTASGASPPLAYGSLGGTAQKLLRAMIAKLSVE